MKKYSPYNPITSPFKPNPTLPNQTESELLKYVLDMKFMNVEQVYKRFKIGIESLVLRGYLTSKDQTLTPESLVRVTEAAHTYLKAQNPNLQIAEPIKSIWSPRVNHDLTLVDLRLRFEELNFINKWYSEQLLRESGFMKRTFLDLPDALCRKQNGNCYFLELEISGKTQKKYEERIDLYSRALEQQEIKEQKVEGVIFMCTDEKVMEVIRENIPKDDRRFSCLNIHRYLPEYKSHKIEKVESESDRKQSPATARPTLQKQQLKNYAPTNQSHSGSVHETSA